MLSFQTSGESHGKALVGVITGLPAGVPIDRKPSTMSFTGGSRVMAEVGAWPSKGSD